MILTNPPVEITQDLRMLGTAGYPVFWFQDAGEGAIFEPGVSAVASVVARQMQSLGLNRDAVRQVVITHGHPDHVMAIPPFRDLFSNMTVLASPTAAKTLTIEKAISFFCKVDQALAESLRQAGILTETDQPQPPAEMKIPIDRTIKEGDTVTVGNTKFSVLETPGHSDCSLSFHEAQRGILIVSDATGFFLPELDWWWPCYFTHYGAYLDSIRRLASLPAQVLCLSHNAVIQGAEPIQEYFQKTLAATETYHRRIVDAVQGGQPARALAEQLGAEVHAKSPLLSLDFFQKNCALLVKQSLQHEGISA